MADAIETFARHVVETAWEELPAAAIRAAKIFILDSLGVGVSGGTGPWAAELVAIQGTWGAGDEARVWGRGTALTAPYAALCNGYQVHNAESDCVHEGAVVHPMAVMLPALLAYAERQGGIGGKNLILAVVLGADVGCGIGLGATTPLTFFRPATAGAFAATAGLAKLRGFDGDALVRAAGIAYSQLSGTMQAHREGSPVLAMQIGFNARGALMASDMAAGGLEGPRRVLEGPFGYYALFEGGSDLAPVLADLGNVWRIAEVAHKPFPCGRATHGIVDACLELMKTHEFAAADVAKVTARVPPLVVRLVARPAAADMPVNHARLSAAYVAARVLLGGAVGTEDFYPATFMDQETLDLAGRVHVLSDGNPDENAMTPVAVDIALGDGAMVTTTIDTVYGNPRKPMSPDAHLAKFRANWRAGPMPLDPGRGEELIRMVDEMERLDDVRRLVDLMCP